MIVMTVTGAAQPHALASRRRACLRRHSQTVHEAHHAIASAAAV